MIVSQLVGSGVAADNAGTVDRPAKETLGAVAARPRLDSIDLLRGLVMVLMVLDHTRDFFGSGGMNPRDVADPGLFLTRWITHFCAPIFILLAGVSASLYGSRGHSRAPTSPVQGEYPARALQSGRAGRSLRSPARRSQVSRFLFTRGLWLIVIEFTLVRFGWTFSFDLNYFIAQVIWVIGASMVVLAALVHLPRWAIASVSLVMIAGHNLFDVIRAEHLGAAGWLWHILHEPGFLHFGPQSRLFALYPLVPWVGVMAAGYALGPVFLLETAKRRRTLMWGGLAVIAGFILLRASNLYGDPALWVVHDNWLATVLSFINVEKYPPSLLYLMMTLGPALVLLALLERARGRLADWITTYGRVPFFFYVLHIMLIHALAVGYAFAVFGRAGWLLGVFPPDKPATYGLSLVGVYAVWLFVLVALYPLCRAFAALKQRRREWYWSYL